MGNYPGARISRSFTREGAAVSSHRPWRFDSPLGTHTSTKQSAKADCAAGTSPEQSAKADSAAGTSAKQSAKVNYAAGTSAKQSAKTECAAGTSAKQSAKVDCAAGTFAKQSTKADCATGTSAKQSAKGTQKLSQSKGPKFCALQWAPRGRRAFRGRHRAGRGGKRPGSIGGVCRVFASFSLELGAPRKRPSARNKEVPFRGRVFCRIRADFARKVCAFYRVAFFAPQSDECVAAGKRAAAAGGQSRRAREAHP